MSMPPLSVEEIYEQLTRSLSPAEQAQLLEKIARNLSQQIPAGEPQERYDWMSVRGVAPNLLAGEDAQAWVSRSRREADEHRDKTPTPPQTTPARCIENRAAGRRL
jgi:hypothetical protein